MLRPSKEKSLFIIYQTRAELSQCPEWEYDTSEFKDTAVTENDWICDKVNRI